MSNAIALDAIASDVVLTKKAPAKKKALARKKVSEADAPAAPKEDKSARARRRKVVGLALIGLVAGEGILTALSLSHLALGISIVTGHTSTNWQDWAFALTFDAVMIVVKSLMLFSKTNQFNADVFKYGKVFVSGCLVVSGAINSMAFAQEAHGLMIYPAILFGVLIPAGIFLLTKIGAAAYMDYSRG